MSRKTNSTTNNSAGKKSTTHNSQPRKSPGQKNPTKPRPNTKRTGERSEAAFLARALHLEFAIAKPWGDSQRYDFILDNGARLWRIQTKCTEGLRADAYETRATYTVGKKRAVYTREDIDFLAAHVVPLDVWYIIPVEVCTPAPMLRMYPHRKAKKMRLEKYRNAWFLLKLKDSPEAGPITIQASAEETTNESDRILISVVILREAPFAERRTRGSDRARRALCGAISATRPSLWIVPYGLSFRFCAKRRRGTCFS